ncbi:abortive infection family protein [Priestia megaterium]|uniref:abortive infection family protein n=1 Tax=Priestia megaterium TaxID=1404 RepID=UPI002B23F6B0|nr:abortive infection family protein [Priestia megaterium]MEB2263611.1 abortive infection family protein [Priestia megaterium]
MNAIEMLEKAKSNIINYIKNYEDYNNYAHMKNNLDHENFRKARIIIRKLSQEGGIEIPSFIKVCRTIEEAIEDLFSDEQPANVQVNYVSQQFNQYIDILEEQSIDVKIVHVECEIPNGLTFESILEAVEKCENRINNDDYSGAVTSAKTLVEGVCKEILHKFPSVSVNNKMDLPALFTKVRQSLNLNPSDPDLDKSLKEVLSGLIKIVNGITEIRNMHGDSHLPKYKIDRHHALIVVNSAKTVVTFLFNTYEYQLEKGTLTIA